MNLILLYRYFQVKYGKKKGGYFCNYNYYLDTLCFYTYAVK